MIPPPRGAHQLTVAAPIATDSSLVAALDAEVLYTQLFREMSERHDGYVWVMNDWEAIVSAPRSEDLGQTLRCLATRHRARHSPDAHGHDPRPAALRATGGAKVLLASPLQSDLSADFDTWISRCLEKSPDRRFSDAREALDSLHAVGSERWSEEMTASWWEATDMLAATEPATDAETLDAELRPRLEMG